MYTNGGLRARNGFGSGDGFSFSSGSDSTSTSESSSGSGFGGLSSSSGSGFGSSGSVSKDFNTNLYQSQATTNSTGDFSFNRAAFIQSITFAAAKSIRTSTIILAVFNTIAASATFAYILYESWQVNKRATCTQRMRHKKEFLAFVSSPDLYPLIVSGAIAIQGVIFAVSQSRGLDGFAGSGCTLIAQFMLPGLMLVPTTQFVFGCELAIRAMRAQPFQERGRWMVPICLTIIGLITLIHFLVADFQRVDDNCFMSLFWFVSDYSVGIFVVLTGYAAILLGITIFVFIKLTRTPRIDPTERVNGSRMIYYLALAVLSNVFMLPFFFVMGFMRTEFGEGPSSSLNLSMIASVVASVSGLMTGGLHLFLRSSSISTIGPKEKFELDGSGGLKSKIRVQQGYTSNIGSSSGSSSNESLDMTAYSKADEANSYDNSNPYQTVTAAAMTYPTTTISTQSPLRSNTVLYPQVATAVQVPQPVQIVRSHSRKTSNYSLFPGQGHEKKASVGLLPSTTYNPNAPPTNNNLRVPGGERRNTLRPPPSVLSNLSRHRRESSMGSQATVQIGLRLSNVEDMPAVIDSHAFNEDDGKVYHLDCPLAIKAAQERGRPSPLSAYPPSSVDDEVAGVDVSNTLVGERRRSLSPSSSYSSQSEQEQEQLSGVYPSRDPIKAARMKTLPPVPMPQVDTSAGRDSPTLRHDVRRDDDDEEDHSEEEQIITLSPTVYTPQSPPSKPVAAATTPPSPPKLPSPRGVGFTNPPNIPRRAESTTARRGGGDDGKLPWM